MRGARGAGGGYRSNRDRWWIPTVTREIRLFNSSLHTVFVRFSLPTLQFVGPMPGILKYWSDNLWNFSYKTNMRTGSAARLKGTGTLLMYDLYALYGLFKWPFNYYNELTGSRLLHYRLLTFYKFIQQSLAIFCKWWRYSSVPVHQKRVVSNTRCYVVFVVCFPLVGRK